PICRRVCAQENIARQRSQRRKTIFEVTRDVRVNRVVGEFVCGYYVQTAIEHNIKSAPCLYRGSCPSSAALGMASGSMGREDDASESYRVVILQYSVNFHR